MSSHKVNKSDVLLMLHSEQNLYDKAHVMLNIKFKHDIFRSLFLIYFVIVNADFNIKLKYNEHEVTTWDMNI